jgi:hypothetical protein
MKEKEKRLKSRKEDDSIRKSNREKKVRTIYLPDINYFELKKEELKKQNSKAKLTYKITISQLIKQSIRLIIKSTIKWNHQQAKL